MNDTRCSHLFRGHDGAVVIQKNVLKKKEILIAEHFITPNGVICTASGAHAKQAAYLN